MADIVERLHHTAEIRNRHRNPGDVIAQEAHEAANEIVSLRADNKAMSVALAESIYEVTHLSGEREDGLYRAIIRRVVVDGWRAAIRDHGSK